MHRTERKVKGDTSIYLTFKGFKTLAYKEGLVAGSLWGYWRLGGLSISDSLDNTGIRESVVTRDPVRRPGESMVEKQDEASPLKKGFLRL